MQYKYSIGDVVHWINSNDVYLGERVIIGKWHRAGNPTYYIDPIDTPWFDVSERELYTEKEIENIMHKRQFIIPLKDGWTEHTKYLVEICMSWNNPIFRAVLSYGFHPHGELDRPLSGNYTYIESQGDIIDPRDCLIIKVVKVLATEKDMEKKGMVLPREYLKRRGLYEGYKG